MHLRKTDLRIKSIQVVSKMPGTSPRLLPPVFPADHGYSP
jgi:hypothetical protein